jgi:hypothetical protein
MAIGFTLQGNLSQRTPIQSALTNLLSGPRTKAFDVENDLTVFRGNLSNTDTFKFTTNAYTYTVKYNKGVTVGTWGDVIADTLAVGWTANDYLPQSYRNQAAELLFLKSAQDQNGQNQISVGDQLVYENVTYNVKTVNSDSTSLPVFDDYVETVPALPLDIEDDDDITVNKITLTDRYVGGRFIVSYNRAFFSAGDIITEIEYGENLLSESDTNFPYKVVEEEFNIDTNEKSFRLESVSNVGTYFDGEDMNQLIFTRKRGVTKSNFLNINEPEIRYEGDILEGRTNILGIDINEPLKTYLDIIDNNIINESSKFKNALYKSEENRFLNRGNSTISVEGVLRYTDPAGTIGLQNSPDALEDDAPGPYLIQSLSPDVLARAFSTFTGVWIEDSDIDAIVVDSPHIEVAKVGTLAFEDDVRLDLHEDEIDGAASPSGSINDPGFVAGQTNGSNDGFTHKMKVVVDEIDEDEIGQFQLSRAPSTTLFDRLVFVRQPDDSWLATGPYKFSYDGTQWQLTDIDNTTILAKKVITLLDAPYPWKVDKWTDAVGAIIDFPTFGDFKDMASPPQDLETIKSTYFILVKKEEEV